MRLIPFVVCALLGLAGCQALPFGNRGGAEPAAAVESPITGGEIAVTSLDGAAPLAAKAVPPPDDQDPAPLAPVPDKMPDAPSGAAPAAAEPVAPVAIKTAAHLACEKRGGRWSVAGGGSAAFCQSPTKDGGKSCQKSTDCTGYCLEKSRTCAPVTPMLGCHDILNETGRMLTQCIN
ncbi:hypothetical protein [Pseudotabrizicola sp.]|uniref:hypothetical protein n=1 Tax=Pseudotabrizicola sp. TaxID=2939647 RepID=UPI00271DF87F|nr:hypothetical protein [Pseudotabrizicola sp.]MDO8883454.1 hypothetical protein [Pseudotabrizicola sp.]